MSNYTQFKGRQDSSNHGQFSPAKKRKIADRLNDLSQVNFKPGQKLTSTFERQPKASHRQFTKQPKSSHRQFTKQHKASHRHFSKQPKTSNKQFYSDDVADSDSDHSLSSDEDDSDSIDAGTHEKSASSSLRKKQKVSKSDPSLSDDPTTDDVDDDDDDDDNDDDEEADDQEQDVEDGEMATHEEENEYAKVKKELSNLPLEDLMKIKERIGLKVFNKIMHGSRESKRKTSVVPLDKKEKNFKRENKNRPREMTAKRQVPIARHMDNLSQKHKHRRDPRFDDLSGEYKDEYFEKNYSFLDDIKEKEKQMVKKELKKTTDTDKKKELQGLLMRMTQQKQVKEIKKKSNAIQTAWKSKEKERIKEGKQPYFLKKSERKKLELAEKFKELQKSGKLEQYMSKKRKKNAQKERKKLPQQMNAKT